MKLIDNINEMQLLSSAWQLDGQRIGFVPTMGNLHAGHLSLVEKAQQVSDRVVVSIFVNPLQFNDKQDYTKYPRTLDEDQAKLLQMNIDALFIPDEQQLYPQGRDAVCKVEVPGLSEILEGASRPGHFTGVATVVSKLFNIVQPDVAVFGEKDFQQLLIIRKMVEDLNMPVHILPMPTSRAADGLAMSSRNNRLTAEQRELAPLLYQTLQGFREALLSNADGVETLQALALQQLRAAGFEPDYIELRDADRLGPATASSQSRVILAAASLGEIRLIDNLRV